MPNRAAGALGLAVLLAAAGRPSLGQPNSTTSVELPADLEAVVRQIVEEERLEAGTPAMSVAVFAGGRTVIALADGLADVEAQIPATTETLFPAASVTKLLTAALVMHEVERGRLSLDAPVNESLPAPRQVRDSTGAPVPVTLRQLLSHSSGLGASGAGIQSDPTERPRSLDEYLAHGLVTVEPAGHRLIYSNDAFALAGWLAGRAGGGSYESLAREVLLDPLGMVHSTFATPSEAGPALAAAYGNIGFEVSGDRRPHQVSSAIAPAGALITTASDLARFGLAILGGGELDGVRVLDAASVEEMLRLGVRAHPRMPEGFGLGFGVRDSPGRKLVYWDGMLAGAAARLALLPEHGAGVAVLSNRPDNEAVEGVATRVLALVVPPPVQRVAAIDPATLDAVAGRFRLLDLLDRRLWYMSWLVEANVEVTDGELLVSLPVRRTPGHFVPVGPDLFQSKGKSDGSYLTFDGDELFVTFLRGRHLPPWQTSRAIILVAVLAVLASLSLACWGLVRWIRRRRRRGSTSMSRWARAS